ncbi:hypothetical protein S40293_08004 [Stachybotrys chartarum IBT 40293]|nr:hypothetical protein S40293_08004 [Stachybotrys chartarum IBT 40293]
MVRKPLVDWRPTPQSAGFRPHARAGAAYVTSRCDQVQGNKPNRTKLSQWAFLYYNSMLDAGRKMAAGSEAPASLPVDSSERAREREIAAFLSAASFPPGLPAGGGGAPFLNPDPTFNALVQLGALRLDCDRSFVSLIDRRYQYVVAEMTRTHALGAIKCAPGDGIYIGVCKLDACYGICPTTMKAFLDETGEWIRTGPNVIANRTRYIVKDFRTDPDYMDRPYIAGYPHITSYLEVPLVSSLGYTLGSYCVVDNKPRDFDNEETIDIMNEIAASIMAHLELRRLKQNRQRSEELIQGLSDFIGYEAPAPGQPHPEMQLGVGPAPCNVDSSIHVPSASDLEPCLEAAVVETTNGPASTELAETLHALSGSSGSSPTEFSDSQAFLHDSSFTQTPPTTPPSTLAFNSLDEVVTEAVVIADTAAPSPRLEAATSQTDGFVGSADIKSTFFRAAATVRRSMNMDGLAFLDAVPSSFNGRTSQHHVEDASMGPVSPTIVQSVDNPSSNTGSSESVKTQLPEEVLRRFIERFPRGNVFSADEYGPIDNGFGPGRSFASGRDVGPDSDSFRRDVATLFQAVPSMARYIIFLPLWHFHRDCWYAAALGWIADPTQAFDMLDVSLLSAFCNSVMTEISRLEIITADRAKSTFVSSLSHELRSPLHGIMASSELLRESISDPQLLLTLDMLDSCGSMLLDTFNNLFDHAKISNIRNSSQQPEPDSSATDLGELVEEVMETVRVGHATENAFQHSAAAKTSLSIDNIAEKGMVDTPLLITLLVEDRTTWTLPIDVGAWKRIVMNIFGNALKYTQAGHIEVGLSVVQRADKLGSCTDHICFSVDDTGRGMSLDFVKYQLFAPFSQEDDLTPGMGLGLSIVQQLVKGLGGTINVRSSTGVGTRVEVLVPLGPLVSHGKPTNPPHITHPTIRQEFSHLKGQTICIIRPDGVSAMLGQPITSFEVLEDQTALLEKALRHIAHDHLGMEVVTGTNTHPCPDADFHILDMSLVMKTKGGMTPTLLVSALVGVKRLIVLCSGTALSACGKQDFLTNDSFHLHQPVGPRKLATVLSSAAKASVRNELASSDSSKTTAVPRSTEKPTPMPLLTKTTALSDAPAQPPTLPLPLQSGSEEDSVSSSLLPTKARHLLLVDDNPININLLTAVVRKLKHSFLTAGNGLEAVEFFKESIRQQRRFDIIFMDISMPVMDGFEATHQIRLLEKEAGIPPCMVVVLTGLSSELSRNEALAKGADLFLTKPIKLDKVRSILNGDWERSS